MGHEGPLVELIVGVLTLLAMIDWMRGAKE